MNTAVCFDCSFCTTNSDCTKTITRSHSLDFTLFRASLGWNSVWFHSAHAGYVAQTHASVAVACKDNSTLEIRGIFYLGSHSTQHSWLQLCGHVQRVTPRARTIQQPPCMHNHHHRKPSHKKGSAIGGSNGKRESNSFVFCCARESKRSEMHSHPAFARVTPQTRGEGRHDDDGKGMVTNHELFERMVDIALSGGHDAAAPQPVLSWRATLFSPLDRNKSSHTKMRTRNSVLFS